MSLAKIALLAEALDTKCLDKRYAGMTAKYRFRCASGHVFERTGKRLRENAACPTCSAQARGQARQTPAHLERLHELARERGGACLTAAYSGARARYEFVCAEGHSWNAPAYRVLEGSWCRACAYRSLKGRPKSASTLQKLSAARRLPDAVQRLTGIAAAHGGTVFIPEYINRQSKVTLRCSRGHQWTTGAGSILSGRWCTTCHVDSRRLSIDDAHAAAAAKGGKCLSTKYEALHRPLTWMCERGHVWDAPLATVRNKGSWCAQCAHLARVVRKESKAPMTYLATGKLSIT